MRKLISDADLTTQRPADGGVGPVPAAEDGAPAGPFGAAIGGGGLGVGRMSTTPPSSSSNERQLSGLAARVSAGVPSTPKSLVASSKTHLVGGGCFL